MLLALFATAFAGEPTFRAEASTSAPLVAAAVGIEWVVHTQVVPVESPEGKVASPGPLDSWVPAHYASGPAKASDVLLWGTLGLGSALVLYDGLRDGEGLTPRLWIVAETLSATLVATDMLKLFWGRPRPYTAVTGDPAVDAMRMGLDSEMSFPSGHASLAAAAAVSTARMLSLSGSTPSRRALAWSTAIVAAASTAALRVAAGKHHPTDVVAGLALGAALGWLVPTLHTRERALALETTASGLALRLCW
jgi:hypothetical protein